MKQLRACNLKEAFHIQMHLYRASLRNYHVMVLSVFRVVSYSRVESPVLTLKRDVG